MTSLFPGFATLAAFAANSTWRESEWAAAQLQPFTGKTLRIELWPRSALTTCTLRVAEGGSWESVDPSAFDLPADVTMRMTPGVAATLAQMPDKPGAALDLAGDPAFVGALRKLHDVLPLAIEDRLSTLAGPIIAHAATRVMRSLVQWPRHAADRLGAATASYLTEEDPVLLHRRSFSKFAEEVELLRARTARVLAKHQP